MHNNRWKRLIRDKASAACCYAIGIALGGTAGLPYLQRIIGDTSDTYRTGCYYRVGAYYQQLWQREYDHGSSTSGVADDNSSDGHRARAIALLVIAAHRDHIWSCVALAQIYQRNNSEVDAAKKWFDRSIAILDAQTTSHGGQNGDVTAGPSNDNDVLIQDIRAQVLRQYGQLYDEYIIDNMTNDSDRQRIAAEAFKYYSSAAAGGDAQAMSQVAEYYLFGKHGAVNQDEANG
jgi:TPR repeat protein